jgi:branched-chain amino acid transport system substrate-binding protein
MKQIVRLASCFGLLLTGLVALPMTHPAAAEVLKYGLITAFSGPAAPWGKAQAVAVEMAVEEINAAGGIKVGDKQYTIELKQYDHAYDPTKAVSAAHQAIEQDGVEYLHVLGGGVIPAIQPIVEQNNVLLMAAGTGTSFLGKEHPLTFRPFYEVAATEGAMLRYLGKTQPDKKNLLFMFPDDDMGHSVTAASTAAASAMGYTVKSSFVGRDVTDFVPIATAALRSSPDIIAFGPVPPSQYAQIVKAARQNGFKGVFLFGDTVDLEQLVKVAGAKRSVGSLAAPAWVDFNTEKGQQWATEFKKRFGSVEYWAAQDYDTVLLLKAALEKAGTTDTKAVAEQLGQISVEGAEGTVRFSGAQSVGLPRILTTPIPVSEVVLDSDGKPALKQVFVDTSQQ